MSGGSHGTRGARGVRRWRSGVAAVLLAALALAAALAASAPGAAQGPPGNFIPPPDAPASVTLTRSGTSITATWDAPAHAVLYAVEYVPDGGPTWIAATPGHSSTTITIGGLDSTKGYTVRVRSRGYGGVSDWTVSNNVAGDPSSTPDTAVSPPGPVASVTVTRGDGSLTASWDAPAGAAYYHVQYRAVDHGSWLLAANAHTGTSITIGGTPNAVTYAVRVRAGNSAGWSDWRESGQAAGYTPPPTPSISASNVTASSATITLNDHGGSWYYRVGGGSGSGGGSGGGGAGAASGPNGETANDCVGPVSGSANLTHLSSGTNYTINAFSGGCTGGAVASGSFATLQSGLTDPTHIKVHRGYDAAAAAGSRGTMDVEWTAVANATGYKVAHTRNWHDFSTETTVTAQTGGKWTAKLTAIDHTAHYWVVVKATGENNAESAWGWSSISWPAIDPRPVYDMTLTRTDAGLTVAWKQCDVNEDWCSGRSEVTRFQIDLSDDGGSTWTKAWEADPDDVTVSNLTTDANGITTGDASATVCGADNAKTYKVRIGVENRMRMAWSQASAASSTVGTYTPTPGARNPCEDFDTLSAAGNHAVGIWSDGTTMWALDYTDDKIYAYSMTTKARDASKDITLWDGALWYDIASDGTTIWVSESNTLDKLFAYDIASRARDTSKDFDLHSDNDWAVGIWTDGVTMYIQDDTDDKIYAYVLATEARDSDKDITLHPDNANGQGLWGDGETLWVADPSDDKAYAYSLSDGARDSAKDQSGLSANAEGIWSDGRTTWIADGTHNAPKIFAYHSIDPVLPVPAPASVSAYRGFTFVDAEWAAVEGVAGYDVEHYHPWNQSRKGVAWVRHATGLSGTSVSTDGLPRARAQLPPARHQELARRHRARARRADAQRRAPHERLDVLEHRAAAARVPAGRDQRRRVALRQPAERELDAVRRDQVRFCHGGTPITHWLINVSADNGKTWTTDSKLTSYTSGSTVTLTGTYGDDNATYKVSIGIVTRFTTVWTEAAVGAKRLDVSNITDHGATLTIVNHSGAWYYQADTGYWSAECTDAASQTSVTLSGNRLQKRTEHLFTAYSDSACATPLGATARFTTTGAALSFTNVSATAATMSIDGHTGQWWYKADNGPHTSCQGPVASGSATASLSLTSGGPTYTYTAYSASGCASANAIDTTTFSTADVTASNLREAPYGLNCFAGRMANGDHRQCATAFTTGANASGYTLRSVTALFDAKTGSPGAFSVEIRENSGGNPGAAVATLSGSNPDTAGFHTFTCSGEPCHLAASTTYHAVMRTYDTGSTSIYYSLETTVDDAEALTPAANGWTIANATRVKTGSGAWTALSRGRVAILSLAADEATTLTASSISGTGATLTIGGRTGGWWHKRTDGPASTTCTSIAAGTATDDLSSLTADTLYGYTAYGASGCAAANAIATTWFSTTDAGVGNLGTAYSTSGVGGSARIEWINAFTTGANVAGYDLTGVTLEFAAKVGSPGNIVVAIHAPSASNAAEPAATATCTLSGSNPDAAGLHTYSGSNCTLSPLTTYYVVVKTASSSSGNEYQLRLTGADGETRHPAANRWSIADTARFKVNRGAWKDDTQAESIVMHIAANELTPHVTNLATASTGDSNITSSKQQGVDFSTGPNSGGYTLTSVTIPLRLKTAGTGTLAITLHGDASGSPAASAVPNATLTGTAPTSSTFKNTVFTCTGSGCDLEGGTKYYVVATLTGDRRRTPGATHPPGRSRPPRPRTAAGTSA